MKNPHEVSTEHQEVLEKLQGFHQSAHRTIREQRLRMEQLFERDVQGVEITPIDINGISGEWVMATNSNPDYRLLYLHGGSFRVGSPKSHRYLTSELAKGSGIAVLAIDYRMQPEFKTIHCHHDARSACRCARSTEKPHASYSIARYYLKSCRYSFSSFFSCFLLMPPVTLSA